MTPSLEEIEKEGQMASSQKPTTSNHAGSLPTNDQGSVAEAMVHVVGGTTGEYSDRSEWLVRAFWTESEARAYVELLTSERQKLPPRSGYDYDEARKIEDAMRAFDPNFSEDYTGTSWWVSSSIPLGNSDAVTRGATAREGPPDGSACPGTNPDLKDPAQ